MAKQQSVILMSLLMLGACASIEGNYAPDCTAFAGNRISLADGRFTWEKFTDTVVVNDAGEVVEQFPDYPLRGRYRLEGETVHFEPDRGEAPPPMHLRQQDGKLFLLTQQQHESWMNAETRPRCPLVRK